MLSPSASPRLSASALNEDRLRLAGVLPFVRRRRNRLIQGRILATTASVPISTRSMVSFGQTNGSQFKMRSRSAAMDPKPGIRRPQRSWMGQQRSSCRPSVRVRWNSGFGKPRIVDSSPNLIRTSSSGRFPARRLQLFVRSCGMLAGSAIWRACIKPLSTA